MANVFKVIQYMFIFHRHHLLGLGFYAETGKYHQ